MPRKKETKDIWPKIIKGSHSTRTEYENGQIEFVTDWDALQIDVRNALTKNEMSVKVVKNKISTTKSLRK